MCVCVCGGGGGLKDIPGSGRDAPRPPSSMPHLYWDQDMLSIPPPQVKFPSAASDYNVVT